MPAYLNAIAFGVLALFLIGGAIMVLASKNVMHAAYWLLEVAVASAGIFYFLSAGYIALMQLMVYAGAVGILVIFTIMITLRSRKEAVRSLDVSLTGLIAACGFFGIIAYAILSSPSLAAANLPAMPSLVAFGKELFSLNGYSFPFEIASLVLTVALVAAVWWTKDGEK